MNIASCHVMDFSFLHNSLVIIFLGASVMQEAIEEVPVFIFRISLQLAAGWAQGHLGLSLKHLFGHRLQLIASTVRSRVQQACHNTRTPIYYTDCPKACWRKHTVYTGLKVPVWDRHFGCNKYICLIHLQFFDTSLWWLCTFPVFTETPLSKWFTFFPGEIFKSKFFVKECKHCACRVILYMYKALLWS